MTKKEKSGRTEIGELGEFGLIDRLTKGLGTMHPSTVFGVGDDAAVLACEGNEVLIVTTDMMCEGTHFDLMYTPLKHLGYKAVISNLSDVYAMNAHPKQITVSLALSNRFSVEAVEEIYAGIYTACRNYNIDLVGGDTTASPKGLTISITAIGRGKKDRITYRHKARVGDLICITGNVGAAYLGLQLLEREKQVYLSNPDVQPDLEDQQYVIGRQLKPEARQDMITLFEKEDLVPTAMIDVSDGVASEIFHICERSKVGAVIEESGVPIHPDAQMMALQFNMDPISCALSGGEDYELIFTIDPKDLEKVKYMPDIYIMGEIVKSSEGIKLHSKAGKIHDLKAQGWRHFGKEEE